MGGREAAGQGETGRTRNASRAAANVSGPRPQDPFHRSRGGRVSPKAARLSDGPSPAFFACYGPHTSVLARGVRSARSRAGLNAGRAGRRRSTRPKMARPGNAAGAGGTRCYIDRARENGTGKAGCRLVKVEDGERTEDRGNAWAGSDEESERAGRKKGSERAQHATLASRKSVPSATHEGEGLRVRTRTVDALTSFLLTPGTPQHCSRRARRLLAHSLGCSAPLIISRSSAPVAHPVERAEKARISARPSSAP